jgi:lauroyl/myristoyl acyltransferase
MPSPLLAPVIAFARRLRYPTLFKITAALFALTLLVPDPLPFVDELLLGLGTLLLATWKDRGKAGTGRDPLDGEARRVDRR